MTEPSTDLWLGREDLAWNILLVAQLTDPPPTDVLRRAADGLFDEHGWPPSGEVAEGDTGAVLATLAGTDDRAHPVSFGRTPDGVAVRGHHANVDGLGLLAALRAVAAPDLVSGAAGVQSRPQRSIIATMTSRLVEALTRPPAGFGSRRAGSRASRGTEVFATRTVDRTVNTAALAHAAVRSISAHNASTGVGGGRVALAVGVSMVGGGRPRIGDDSAFLRLTEAQRLDLEAMSRALETAPLQVGGTARSGAARRAGGLIRWASRALSSRLGSTVLVSHLGRVEADGLTGMAFYPLAGTGSGLSVGAATVGHRTTLTARAPGPTYATSDLEGLLDAIAASLS